MVFREKNTSKVGMIYRIHTRELQKCWFDGWRDLSHITRTHTRCTCVCGYAVCISGATCRKKHQGKKSSPQLHFSIKTAPENSIWLGILLCIQRKLPTQPNDIFQWPMKNVVAISIFRPWKTLMHTPRIVVKNDVFVLDASNFDRNKFAWIIFLVTKKTVNFWLHYAKENWLPIRWGGGHWPQYAPFHFYLSLSNQMHSFSYGVRHIGQC